MTFRMGFSQSLFQPPIGKAMGGYMPLRHATGSHDSLYAKSVCLVEATERRMIIFTSFDLVAVDQLLQEAILVELRPDYPDWQLELFLFATHTHSGPAGTLETRSGLKRGMTAIFGDTDETILSLCVEAGISSIRESLAHLEEFVYGKSRTILEGVGTDRNDPQLEGDEQLALFNVRTASGRQLLLWHFPLHPTILKGDNTLYSADFPGRVAALLPEFDVVLFLNGNCGNISTRFTRKGDSFGEVDRFSQLIATAILQNLPARQEALRAVRIAHQEVTLRPQPNSPFLVTQEEIPVRYTLLHWDSQPFILMPAEVTSSLTRELRRENDVLFLCYCNDYLFYFADETCFRDQTYEAQSSLIAEGEAERVLEEVARQLQGQQVEGQGPSH